MYMNTRTYTYTHVHAYINVYTQISVSVCMFSVLFLNRTNDKPSKCPISALMFLYKKKNQDKHRIFFPLPRHSRGLHNNPNFKRGNPCLFYPPRRYPSPTSVADPQSLQPVLRRSANPTQITYYFSTLKKKKKEKKNTSRILTVNKTRHLEAFFPNLKILSFYVLDS